MRGGIGISPNPWREVPSRRLGHLTIDLIKGWGRNGVTSKCHLKKRYSKTPYVRKDSVFVSPQPLRLCVCACVHVEGVCVCGRFVCVCGGMCVHGTG